MSSDHQGRFDVMLDERGNPPCAEKDACPVCRVFDGPRIGESRAEWLARITSTVTVADLAAI